MWVLTHVTGMEHKLFHSVTHGVPLENLLDRAVLLGLNLDGGWGAGVGWGWVRSGGFYIWHCVPNILLWSILCKTVGLPSSTGESERTARRQFHSPTLRCFRGRLCEVAAGRGPLKHSRWPESNWTLPLRSVGVAPSLGRFWLVFTAIRLRYVLRRHIILSDSDGNQGVLDCFTVYPGLGGSAKWFYVACCDGS